MLVKQAKAVARRWVIEEAANAPGFRGAFVHGSANWLPDDGTLAATSDLDVMVVHADPDPPHKPGKFLYRDVLLEVSYLPSNQLQSPDVILGQYQLAGSFHSASVIADPTGRLTELQTAAAGDYAKRRWVERRCEDARNNVLTFLRSFDESAPFHDQVTAWLFATGVMTHVLLVAGLRNPTVRRRYLAARELLADYGRLDFYESLLALLGCARMNRLQVEHHLAALADAFDAAKAVITTPFVFAADISDVARPVAIDSGRELIACGFHREAVFWIVATYARCQKVFTSDAPPEMQARYEPGFRRLLADLGVTSSADLRGRCDRVEAFLPRIWEEAEAVMATNPAIEDEPGLVMDAAIPNRHSEPVEE